MNRIALTLFLLFMCFSFESKAQSLRYSKDPNVHFQQFRFEIDPNGKIQLPLPKPDTPVRIEISVTHIAGDYLSVGDVPLEPIVSENTITQDSRTGTIGAGPHSCGPTPTFIFLACTFLNFEIPNGPAYHLSVLLKAYRATNQVFLEFDTNETAITKPLNVCINVYY